MRRLADGALMSVRGEPAEEWIGVAKGAVRVSSVSLSGKQVTLTYVEPGIWFGGIALFDGLPRTHDRADLVETTARDPEFAIQRHGRPTRDEPRRRRDPPAAARP